MPRLAVDQSSRQRKERLSALPTSLPPRGIDRIAAAEFIGVSPTKFDEMVKDRRMPRPKRIDARVVWDVKALDRAFEALPDDDPAEAPANDPWSDVRV